MKLRHTSLDQYLQKEILPLYWLSGDEPLLMQETMDSLCNGLKQRGYACSNRFQLEAGFDWQLFMTELQNLSLFSDQSLIILHLGEKSLPDAGKKLLQHYLINPAPDKVILLTSGKLEAATLKTKWFQAIEQFSGFVQIWPLQRYELFAWVQARLQQKCLRVDKAGINLLVDWGEGNLLAIKQDIEKLTLLYSEGSSLTIEEIKAAGSDNARFDLFNLADAVLLGDVQRALKIMQGLKQSGSEAILVLWALVRDLRLLSRLQAMAEVNDQVLQRQGVWPKRMPLVKKALARRVNYADLLVDAAQIDKTIKGVSRGNVWDDLQRLILVSNSN